MKSKPYVAVDADTLVFSAACAAETRSIEVTHSSGATKLFKNRTEFKEHMKAKSKKITTDYSIKDIQEPEDVSHALQIVKNSAEGILDRYNDCEVVFFCTCENNWRDLLPYPTPYKGNRVGMVKPLLLKDCQDYLRGKYKAVRAYGREIDEETSIQAYKAVEQEGRQGIILSPDGDSRQFDGLYLGNSYKTEQSDLVKIEFMHDVSWSDKGFQSYGFPWMILQLSIGDRTDSLAPTYLCKARYGEKGCYNDLVKLKTPEEFANHAIQKYKQWYPEKFTYLDWRGEEVKADWKFMLNLYWKGTTMMRRDNEYPDFWEFLQERGVEYAH